ncbi:MAG: hypothetical protein ACYDCG_20270 [Candidatus Acidiferrales bacterium]
MRIVVADATPLHYFILIGAVQNGATNMNKTKSKPAPFAKRKPKGCAT